MYSEKTKKMNKMREIKKIKFDYMNVVREIKMTETKLQVLGADILLGDT